MCGLCEQDKQKRKAAEDQINYEAESLESIARSFRAMARGGIKPHSKQAAEVGAKAVHAIRFLVADWL